MSAETRALALDLACRVGPITGADSTGHVLSTARQFDKYLTTGITRYGKHDDRIQVDDGRVHVIIDADATARLDLQELARTVSTVLARAAH